MTLWLVVIIIDPDTYFVKMIDNQLLRKKEQKTVDPVK